jgi:hypothetical protein
LTACEKGVDFADSAVELWIAPPDPSDPTHNQPLQPAPLVVTTPTVYKFTPMPAIEQATHMADYPKLVASRTVPGLVFMTGRNNAFEAGGGQEFIAAYQRNTNGQFERKGHLSIANATLQPVLAADDAGFIYAVVAINDDQNSPTFGVSPVVKKFQYDGTAITQVASGSPPVVPNVAYGNTTTLA